MSHPLKRIVEHPVRLDVLCGLADGEPLSVIQITTKIGKTRTETGYHVEVLAAQDLVAREGESDKDGPLYVARLDDHPDWVRKSVEDHRGSD